MLFDAALPSLTKSPNISTILKKKDREVLRRTRDAKRRGMPSPIVDEMKDKNPRENKPDREPKYRVFNWVKTHKVTATLVGISGGSFPIVLGYFGTNPRILYIPAVAICALLCWLVLSFVHKYVQMELNPPISSPVEMTVQNGVGLGFREKIESVTVTFGGVNLPFDISEMPSGRTNNSLRFVVLGDLRPVRLYVENGRLYCDAEFRSLIDMSPIKIERNVLSGRPHGYDWNHNERAIEVVNDALVPVFQMYWKSDSHVVINGIFVSSSGVNLCMEGKTLGSSWEGIRKHPNESMLFVLRRIFKYPSYKHPGQTDDPNSPPAAITLSGKNPKE